MGWVAIPEPGSEFGPCLDEKCGHTDCAASREQAAAKCRVCGEPIGYNRGFYGPDETGRAIHFACIDEELKSNRK